MILLFSLICPNGHPVGGEPHEYPGAERPPEKWMDNVSKEFARHIRSRPEEWKECHFCHAPIGKGCSVEVSEMKAQTMEEAEALLAQVAERPKAATI